MDIVPGTVVKISNLSKPSYYLYRSYLQYSPLLICPCHVKRDVPMTVEDIINKNIVLLKGKRKPFLTIVYKQDLEPVYERN